MGVFVEEQDDLASRTLARIAVLQPLGAIAKDVLAARAIDLDGIFHGSLEMSARSLPASSSMKQIRIKAGESRGAGNPGRPGTSGSDGKLIWLT
ncbi:hypothetical protein [Bradyrhizobium sp. LTSP885]|uniref:hypothetical protein n=1 Tax=Bradyrhizobium sp. LTSP885 TaxID=1619232 RepID=UPI0012E0876C|nr:hypothetical protein [Bradyrhizobium sp. LTSP885]